MSRTTPTIPAGSAYSAGSADSAGSVGSPRSAVSTVPATPTCSAGSGSPCSAAPASPLGTFNVIVGGVGGQGTVLAAKLLAQCALNGGVFVRSAETIGMAQRGGSVLGHVRISDEEGPSAPASPLIAPGQAQLLIGFEPAETLRALRFCNPESLVVTATRPLVPHAAGQGGLVYDGTHQLEALAEAARTGNVARLVAVSNEAVSAELGFDRALNVVLLGAALGALGTLDTPATSTGHGAKGATAWLTYEAMQATIKTTVKEGYVAPNLRALEIGYHLS